MCTVLRRQPTRASFPGARLTLIATLIVASALTAASDQEQLGARLFSDARLSADGSISCSSCHQPARAFTDGLRVARGVGGREGARNTPSLLDVRLQNAFFWDGRRATLESQAGDPFVNPNEHGLADHEALVAKVRADAAYETQFTAAFGAGDGGSAINLARIEKSLATYVRTLSADDSRFDRYAFHGERTALDAAEQRGLRLFKGRARCSSCHTITSKSAPLSDGAFHATLVPESVAEGLASLTTLVARAEPAARSALLSTKPDIAELGRFVATLDPADIGKFRTPSLRNVAITAPYFHDGSVSTLSEAVSREAYVRGGLAQRRLILTPAEIADLVAFLQSLTSASQLDAAKRPLPVR